MFDGLKCRIPISHEQPDVVKLERRITKEILKVPYQTRVGVVQSVCQSEKLKLLKQNMVIKKARISLDQVLKAMFSSTVMI